MKLYTNSPAHFLYFTPKIVVELTNAKVETVVVSQEEQDTAEFKAKRQHGKFPMLELADGTMIYESNGIAAYFARTSGSAPALVGSDAFEEAQIEQWVLIAATGNWPHAGKIAYNTLGMAFNLAQYNDAVKGIKDQVKVLNTHL